MEKENICFFRRRRKKRQIVREGKGVKIFGKGKKILCGEKNNGEGKGGKYVFLEEKKSGKGKRGKYLEEEKFFGRRKRRKAFRD